MLKGNKAITWVCNQTNLHQMKGGRVIMRGYTLNANMVDLSVGAQNDSEKTCFVVDLVCFVLPSL